MGLKYAVAYVIIKFEQPHPLVYHKSAAFGVEL